MRRLWRFILALSVTPLMTAACLAILGWMTWRLPGGVVYGTPGAGHNGSLVGSVIHPKDTSWQSVGHRIDPIEPWAIVFRNEQTYRIVKPSQPEYRRWGEYRAVLFLHGMEEPQQYGWYALTHERRDVMSQTEGEREFQSMSIREIIRGHVSPDEWQSIRAATGWQRIQEQEQESKVERSWMADAITEHPRVGKFASMVRQQTRVIDTQPIYSGYVYNTLAVMVIVACLWSLQWIWRGARMPWGRNRSWMHIAGESGWQRWIVRILLFSPITTFLCGVYFVLVLIWFKAPLSWNFERLRNDWLQSVSHASPRVIMNAEWAGIEREDGLFIRSWTFGDVMPTAGVPMQSVTDALWNIKLTTKKHGSIGWPLTMLEWTSSALHITPEPRSDVRRVRGAVERYLLHYSFISQDDVGGLWDRMRWNIRWKAVRFNLACIAIVVLMVVSCRWMRDGVVWPWNARRIRLRLCRRCDYSLIGLSGEKCPECGEPAAA